MCHPKARVRREEAVASLMGVPRGSSEAVRLHGNLLFYLENACELCIHSHVPTRLIFFFFFKASRPQIVSKTDLAGGARDAQPSPGPWRVPSGEHFIRFEGWFDFSVSHTIDTLEAQAIKPPRGFMEGAGPATCVCQGLPTHHLSPAAHHNSMRSLMPLTHFTEA